MSQMPFRLLTSLLQSLKQSRDARGPPFTCESAAPMLQGEQTRPLLILILLGLCDFGRQIQRLLEEAHQRLFGEQRGQDLSVAHHPIALHRHRTPAAPAGVHAAVSGGRLRASRRYRVLLTAAGFTLMASLTDLQHESGDRGDGLEEVILLQVTVEHAVERFTELDELPLGEKE